MKTGMKSYHDKILCVTIIMMFFGASVFTQFVYAQEYDVPQEVILISGFMKDNGKTEDFAWERLEEGYPEIPLNNPGNLRIYYSDISGNIIEETGFEYSDSIIIFDGLKGSFYDRLNSMMIATFIPYVEGTYDIKITLEEDIVKKKNDLREFSPYKQFEMGIEPIHIVCKEGYELLLRSSDEKPPKCVKPYTRDKLVERYWAIPVISNR